MTICQSCGAGVHRRVRCRHKPCGMMVCDYCLKQSHQRHVFGAPVYLESVYPECTGVERSEGGENLGACSSVHLYCGITCNDEMETRH